MTFPQHDWKSQIHAALTFSYTNGTMLLSHRKKFIFIRVPKVATSSMHTTLRPYAVNPFQAFFIKGTRFMRYQNEWTFSFRPHITAMELQQKTNGRIFENYFKFAFVRNPYDREVSFYHWIIKTKLTPKVTAEVRKMNDFSEYVKHIDEVRSNSNLPLQDQVDYILGANGRQIVDFIGRYERLAEDFETVQRTLELPSVHDLPAVNTSSRRKNGDHDYRAYYDDDAIETVSRLRKPDLTYFGYSF